MPQPTVSEQPGDLRHGVRPSVHYLLMAMLSAAFFTGCAARDFEALKPGLEGRGHYIEGVPFYRQEENFCGPAALAGVASFWGRQVSMDELVARVYLPQLRGTLPMDMEKYLRDSGFKTISRAGTLDELKAQVRRNMPVICLLDLGFSLYRRPHYVIVVGFDDVYEEFIAHDGLRENTMIGYKRFAGYWRRADNWMLVAVPGELSKETDIP